MDGRSGARGYLAPGCRALTEIRVRSQKLSAETQTPQPLSDDPAQHILERQTHSIDVLRRGCVGSVRPVALEGEVVFGPEQEKKKNTIT